MEAAKPRAIEFRLHGLTGEAHGRVSARLFANKLKQFVSALEAADAIANGTVVHTYDLVQMHMSQPTAVLAERPRPSFSEDLAPSIPVFTEAVEGIKTGDARVDRLAPVIRRIALLTAGAGTTFGFVEARPEGDEVVRIDKFLRDRAAEVRSRAGHRWFDGAVMGSFDGTLEYVDIRGDLPQIKLTLTAGGKEIDCICRKDDIDTIKESLDRRVRVYGRAIYSGAHPMPVRVEINSFEPVKADADFTRWKGSFRPFAAASWDGEE